jgi:hypothetical protein
VYSWWNETAGKIDWTARCVSDTCGYRGQYIHVQETPYSHRTVKIDQYFQLPSIGTFQYPQRGSNLLCCSTTDSLTDVLDTKQRVLPIGLEWDHREQTELLSRLDSAHGNGISEKEFRVLFKCCKNCVRVGVRPAMKRHICLKGVQKDRRYRYKSVDAMPKCRVSDI